MSVDSLRFTCQVTPTVDDVEENLTNVKQKPNIATAAFCVSSRRDLTKSFFHGKNRVSVQIFLTSRCLTSGMQETFLTCFQGTSPEDGVSVFGLYLDGARWSSDAKTLQDSAPTQRWYRLPQLHFMPTTVRVRSFPLHFRRAGAPSAPQYGLEYRHSRSVPSTAT